MGFETKFYLVYVNRSYSVEASDEKGIFPKIYRSYGKVLGMVDCNNLEGKYNTELAEIFSNKVEFDMFISPAGFPPQTKDDYDRELKYTQNLKAVRELFKKMYEENPSAPYRIFSKMLKAYIKEQGEGGYYPTVHQSDVRNSSHINEKFLAIVKYHY